MRSTRNLVAVAAALVVAAAGVAVAQTMPGHQAIEAAPMQQSVASGQHPMDPDRMREMVRQHHGMMPMSGHRGTQGVATTPTLPGQDAFGAIQEIVQLLDADPKTDWSKVDLEALRQHLIDMNEVTLHAEASPRQIDGGLEVAITGSGRTLAAIQRMIPSWTKAMNRQHGWSASAAPLPKGELLTVTAADPKEVQHIRGLGFIGLLVSGSHHQPHHLAMAKGEFDPEHLGHTH